MVSIMENEEEEVEVEVEEEEGVEEEGVEEEVAQPELKPRPKVVADEGVDGIIRLEVAVVMMEDG